MYWVDIVKCKYVDFSMNDKQLSTVLIGFSFFTSLLDDTWSLLILQISQIKFMVSALKEENTLYNNRHLLLFKCAPCVRIDLFFKGDTRILG